MKGFPLRDRLRFLFTIGRDPLMNGRLAREEQSQVRRIRLLLRGAGSEFGPHTLEVRGDAPHLGQDGVARPLRLRGRFSLARVGFRPGVVSS